jgi:hypothetical protein
MWTAFSAVLDTTVRSVAAEVGWTIQTDPLPLRDEAEAMRQAAARWVRIEHASYALNSVDVFHGFYGWQAVWDDFRNRRTSTFAFGATVDNLRLACQPSCPPELQRRWELAHSSGERRLAERVGFEPLPVVENKELNGFRLPHDPPDPHESPDRDTYLSTRKWIGCSQVSRRGQARRATTISVRPTTNAANMSARRREVPGGAFLNSFQINTPHKAATRVAPCPNP